mmetsp:Transcript_34896/g.81494  ORF Transcript_34896/g.81494 Transcript_34896/m.81494 type:complete len:115 (+) Transcript_34896:53-397(+)
MRETLRKKLVNAMKFGHLLLVNFGVDPVFSLSAHVADDETFPLSILRQGVATRRDEIDRITRPEDTQETGIFSCAREFRVALVSSTPAAEWPETVAPHLPIHQLHPIVIKSAGS